MAWPKGKPRGPRKQSPFSLDAINVNFGETGSTTPSEEDQSGDGDQVMSVGADGIFGIKIDSSLRSCVVLRRRIYKVETPVQYPVKGGTYETKVYKPGDFSEWEFNNATYHPTPEFALDYIAGVMRKQKLKEANDITKYLQICREVNADLMNVLKAVKESAGTNQS